MAQPKGYVDPQYLKQVQEILTRTKQRTYELMHIHTGSCLLDVGCGPGTDTVPLAAMVDKTGRVVGVDFDPTMIAEANQRAAEADITDRVQHYQADVLALPFEANVFDASRSERVFQHLVDPAGALAEMVRVTKPGGWIVVMEPDRGTLSFDTDEIDIERRIVRFFAEQFIQHGYMGRQLYRYFKRQQLVDITVEVHPQVITNYAVGRRIVLLDEVETRAMDAGVLSEGELQRWHQSLEQAESEGTYFHSLNMVMVAGRKA